MSDDGHGRYRIFTTIHSLSREQSHSERPLACERGGAVVQQVHNRHECTRWSSETSARGPHVPDRATPCPPLTQPPRSSTRAAWRPRATAPCRRSHRRSAGSHPRAPPPPGEGRGGGREEGGRGSVERPGRGLAREGGASRRGRGWLERGGLEGRRSRLSSQVDKEAGVDRASRTLHRVVHRAPPRARLARQAHVPRRLQLRGHTLRVGAARAGGARVALAAQPLDERVLARLLLEPVGKTY